jgi:hypothetical protein
MKIAYVFTATGKYSKFIDELVTSGIKNFFPNDESKFIVFTDSEPKDYGDKVIYVYQEKLGWPLDTLKRYHLINSIQNLLSDFDYILYGNANMIFLEEITNEILPTGEEDNGLCAVVHPSYYKTHKTMFTYERNPNSTAFVDHHKEGDTYYQGCFFGGKTKEFLKMSKILQDKIQIDLDNNFIAVWWDESHMNKYFIDVKPKPIHPGYSYPENDSIPYDKKILQLNKHNHGGHDKLRG